MKGIAVWQLAISLFMCAGCSSFSSMVPGNPRQQPMVSVAAWDGTMPFFDVAVSNSTDAAIAVAEIDMESNPHSLLHCRLELRGRQKWINVMPQFLEAYQLPSEQLRMIIISPGDSYKFRIPSYLIPTQWRLGIPVYRVKHLQASLYTELSDGDLVRLEWSEPSVASTTRATFSRRELTRKPIVLDRHFALFTISANPELSYLLSP